MNGKDRNRLLGWDLQDFWKRFSKSILEEIRLGLLKEYSEKIYENKFGLKLKIKRDRFNRTSRTWGKRRKWLGSSCRVCSSGPTITHHIIQLKNGGTNHKRNMISLCEKCHAEIHPWLRA